MPFKPGILGITTKRDKKHDKQPEHLSSNAIPATPIIATNPQTATNRHSAIYNATISPYSVGIVTFKDMTVLTRSLTSPECARGPPHRLARTGQASQTPP
jgi:hypothetical protein